MHTGIKNPSPDWAITQRQTKNSICFFLLTHCLICVNCLMLAEKQPVPKNLSGTLVTKSNSDFEQTQVALKDLYKDQTLVLYFYPKDMTPGCITEAVNFQEHISAYKKLKAQIIGCSRDTTKSHCNFIAKKELSFPLLSDDSGKITEAFGVWAEKSMYGKKFMGIIRSTFIIEKGIVIKAYPKVSVKEHAKEVLDFLKEKK